VELNSAWVYPGEASTLPSQDEMYQAVTRHFEGFVLAFADGHVKHMRPSRWTPLNVGGRFMLSNDSASPWPPSEYQGIVITMHCLGATK
jgi:prepilin-type processing-associated H-X9-DG protein